MKRVLITGENSYIGLSAEKYITQRYPDECEFDKISLVDGSWRDKSFAGYDVVLHVAGLVHKKETSDNCDLYYAVNRDLTLEVANKAKAEGVSQFIFLSTMSVYGMVEGKISKDTIAQPKSNYGKSKLQAEEGLKQLECDTFGICMLRPPMIYGKDCKGNYQTLRKLALKLSFFPYVNNSRSMLYIDNLSEFIRLMILNEERGVFFPQNKGYVNTTQMVKLIALSNEKKISILKGFGLGIKLMGLLTSAAKKAFGSLTYDEDMSTYPQDYQVVDLTASIKQTEQG